MNIIQIIGIWILTYLTPMLVGTLIRKRILNKDVKFANNLIHYFLLLSMFMSFIFVLILNININFLEINMFFYIFLISIFISYFFMKKFAILYGLSSIIQELTMIFIILILSQQFNFYLVCLLVAPIYIYAHDFEGKEAIHKKIIISLWGIITISLFYLFQNAWINISLHFIWGTLLVSLKILYTDLISVKS